LGSGGFGKTYLAEDVDKLNEKCVIKQFAPQSQGSAALQKSMELFEQEARQLQQLGEHPQIPRLLAYFEEEHRLYLVQQFIDGQNLLKEFEEQGNFDDQKIRELLLELLEILKVVHQHKVVHRDIKPDNIIRCSSDRKLVLIDFGASKQLKTTVMAGKGTVIGTYGYVPMEQMQSGEAYPASDLYSLGATCFHLWSGIHPWELWKTQAYGWVNNWRSRLQQPVNHELGQVLDKLLHEDYQQRYQSVEEAITDLTTKSSPSGNQSPNINQPKTSRKLPISLFLLLIFPLISILRPSFKKIESAFRNQNNKARESEGKIYIGSMNRAQQAFFVENNKFAENISDLALGIKPEMKNYTFKIVRQSNQTKSVINIAQTNYQGLKSFIGLVYVEKVNGTNNIIPIAKVCEANQSLSQIPKIPETPSKEIQCPSGFKLSN
jgi:serine/threonine protein kinase